MIYHKKGGCVEKTNKRARARFAGVFFREIDFSVDKYSRGNKYIVNWYGEYFKQNGIFLVPSYK